VNATLEAEAAVGTKPAERLLIVNPLEYPDWDGLVAAHRESSFFHGSAWARVLNRTYGHAPLYFCKVAEKKLRTLLPIMEVSSIVSGRRGVSLPFSDFCTPMAADEAEDTRLLYEAAVEYGRERKWRYLECRNDSRDWSGDSIASVGFHGHVIELGGSEEALFSGLDSAMRRGIRKADKEGLRVEFSTRPEAIEEFFRLHCGTRKRHGLPPQPIAFFKNIARYILGTNQGFVATASTGQQAVGAFIVFHSKDEAIYKFGASDSAYQHLRPNNLLMWEVIKRCAAKGMTRLHLGRTSVTNEGLRRFKLGFGAREERIEYRKYDFGRNAFVAAEDRAEGWVNHVFRCMPVRFLRLSGEVLYPHIC
jgi:CelD/BcsL family acetyltransferase involved in cellulose biosynthesis